jgi:hypothetical protein
LASVARRIWSRSDAAAQQVHISEVRSLGKLGTISHHEEEAGGIGELKSGKLDFDAARFKNAADLEKFRNERGADLPAK